MSQKGTCTCGFGPFWAILGENALLHAPFLDFLVLILNVLLILGPRTFYPGLVAPPENGKTFKIKTRTPVFWTAN